MRETWTPAPPATWHSGASSSSQPPGHIDQISSNYSQFYHHMEGQASQKANHTCHPVNILNMGNGEPGKSDMGNSFVAPLCGHAQFPGIENIWFLKSKTSLSTNNPLINGNDVLLRGGDYGMALPDVGVCHSSPTKNGSCQMSPGASGIHQENGNEPATSVLMLGPNGSYSANPFSSETRLPECSNHRKVGPLVFCMNRVGELFLNDMGLLGVLCLCHGICMSVAQFCEHSGSKQLDPGYAVCLENGESIACWRRLFLLNSGMRDSDDFTGWNWPEATFGSTGSMVTDTLTLKASAYKTSWMDSSFISFGRSPVDSCTSADNVRVGHIALKKLLNRVSDASLRLHNESLNSLKSQGDQLHAFPRSQFSDKRLWVADGTHTHGNLGVSTSLLNMGRHNEGQHLTSQEPVERSGKWMMSKDSLARKTLGGHTDIFCSGFELNYGAQARQHITGVNSGSFARLHTSETLSNPVNHQRHKFLSPKSYDLQKLEEPSLHCPSEGLTPNRCNLQQSNGSSNVIHLPDSESARSETHNGSPLTLFHLNTYEGNSTSQATDNDISHTQKSMSRVLEVESFADLNLKLAGVTNDGLERTSKITTMDTSAQICSGNTTRISSNGNCNCAWRPECFVPDSEGPMEAVDEQFTQSTSSFFNWRACSHSHDVLAGETKSSTIKQLGKELCQEKNGIHLHCLAWPKSMNSISYSRGLKQHLLDGNSSFCALKHMNDLCNKEAVPPLGKTHDRSLCCLSSVGLDGKEKEKGLMKLDKEAAESHSACFIQPCGPFGRTASSMQLVGPCSGGCSSCLLECDKRYMTLHSNCANMQPMFRFGRIDNEFANNAPHEFCNNDLSRCSTCKCLEVPGQKGYRKENCNTCTCHGISRCLSSHYFPEEKCINDLVKPSSVCCKAHFVPTSASHVNNDNRSNGCGVLEKHDVHLANDDHMQNSWNNIHIDPTIISIQKMHDILQSGVTDGQLVDTLKDYNDLSHEGRTSMDNHMSSIFPGYSAPAATEISIEADRGSYDSGAGQHSTADNLKDAGSSIERCGSSDGTCNSRKHRVDLSSNDKVNAMNGSFEISVQSSDAPNNVVMPGDSVNQEKLVSLLGSGENVHVKSDQKLQEGNRIKKWKKQDTSILKSDLPSTQSDLANRDEHFSVNYVEKNLHIQPINRMHKGDLYAVESFNCSRKQTALPRLKKHSLSNLQDSNGLIDEANSHSKVPKRFFTPLPRKKFRKLFSLNANALKTKQVEFHGSEEKHSNNTVTSGRKRLYSNGVEICQNDIRPVVCGDFGVISNRGLPADLQPPKIVLLSSVMKYARRTTLVKDEEYAKSTRLGMCETELKAYGGKSCDSITKDQPIATTFIANIRTKYIHTISSNSELHPGLPTSQSKRRKTNKRSLNELTEEDRLSGENFLHCELCKVFNSIANDGHCRGQTSCLSPQNARNLSNEDQNSWSSLSSDSFCCVCGSQDKDDANHLVECSKCLIKVHQACYGISKIPKERWFCRPCHTNSRDIACVICGYGGGAMTRAIRSQNIVKSLLKAWTIEAESQPIKPISSLTKMLEMQDSSRPTLKYGSSVSNSPTIRYLPSITRGAKQPNNPLPLYQVKNSVTDGARDPSIMQWVHVVCGLWTPGTRCRNVDTMSTFDVSGAYASSKNMVCLTCNRPGGCCIQCRVLNCSANFHPWCAHQKGLLQCEVEGTDPEKVGFYGRCFVHTLRHPAEGHPVDIEGNTCGTDDSFCARTKGYRGRNNEGFRWKAISSSTKGDASYLVPPEQMNAWVHINGQKSRFKQAVTPVSLNTEHDCRKEYVRYKSAKGWKSLVVYKSGIHALGLYTSRFIPRGAMVVEYVGEIVGLRVADKRETEYQSDSKLQHKSACYFFRIDKEHIIDATRKGGIARFVNHSCLPNCVAKIITVKNQKKVVFFAERDIYPGEEITYDYHFNHEDEANTLEMIVNVSFRCHTVGIVESLVAFVLLKYVGLTPACSQMARNIQILCSSASHL